MQLPCRRNTHFPRNTVSVTALCPRVCPQKTADRSDAAVFCNDPFEFVGKFDLRFVSYRITAVACGDLRYLTDFFLYGHARNQASRAFVINSHDPSTPLKELSTILYYGRSRDFHTHFVSKSGQFYHIVINLSMFSIEESWALCYNCRCKA